MSETRQGPPETERADRRHVGAPRSPGPQPSGSADHVGAPRTPGPQPSGSTDHVAAHRPPAVLPPTPPYGTPTARPTIPPTPPYGTAVPGVADDGHFGPTYGPGHRDGWTPATADPPDDEPQAYSVGGRRGRVPTAVKVLAGVALVVAALVVIGRLTDADPFADTLGGTPAGEAGAGGAAQVDPTAPAVGVEEWAAIARDPDRHRGERINVAGRVTRLWSADDGTARATVGGSLPSGVRRAVTPVALIGSDQAFRTLRVDDEVMLRAVVEGETADGMPVLRVEASSVLQTG